MLNRPGQDRPDPLRFPDSLALRVRVARRQRPPGDAKLNVGVTRITPISLCIIDHSRESKRNRVAEGRPVRHVCPPVKTENCCPVTAAGHCGPSSWTNWDVTVSVVPPLVSV